MCCVCVYGGGWVDVCVFVWVNGWLCVCTGRTTVVEVPYMEGFICKRKSYVDAGRV